MPFLITSVQHWSNTSFSPMWSESYSRSWNFGLEPLSPFLLKGVDRLLLCCQIKIGFSPWINSFSSRKIKFYLLGFVNLYSNSKSSLKSSALAALSSLSDPIYLLELSKFRGYLIHPRICRHHLGSARSNRAIRLQFTDRRDFFEHKKRRH